MGGKTSSHWLRSFSLFTFPVFHLARLASVSLWPGQQDREATFLEPGIFSRA
jgi:hypothetical protein